MTKAGSEERYPLLLLYVEENGRKSEFPQRVVFADKGRGNSVSHGAAAIITQWPAQVASCWITSVALGIAFIFVALLLFMSSFNPLTFPIHPRCAREVTKYGNRTIHLVKHGSTWNHKQLDILRFIADNYPDFEIRNIVLEHSLKNFNRVEKKNDTAAGEKRHFQFHLPDFTNTFVNKLNEILKKDKISDYADTTENTKKPQQLDEKQDEKLDKKQDEKLVEKLAEKQEKKQDEASSEENDIPGNLPKNNVTKRSKRSIYFFKLPSTYEDILKTYPNIKEKKTTYKEYFASTPLHYFWVDYSPAMILYSVRVLELWQNGGISFYIPINDHHKHETIDIRNNITTKQVINKTNLLKTPDINISRLKLHIASTKFRYDKLTDDLVSIDEQGLHMATKIACHSFFGEMIIKLQKNIEYITVPDFIQRILNLFCGRGAVDSEYCMKNKK